MICSVCGERPTATWSHTRLCGTCLALRERKRYLRRMRGVRAVEWAVDVTLGSMGLVVSLAAIGWIGERMGWW